ncbi:MAG: hypothetical protein HMLKMBBP_03553 [Planctomycetes bacterium]|nr:hypothetical protein [Planctomycetota bacterium]
MSSPASRPTLEGPPLPRWVQLSAGDIMQTRVLSVADTSPLSEVERVLCENRISGCPVVDQSGRIVGVVSLRDLVERYVEDPDARPKHGRSFYEMPSEEITDPDDDAYEPTEEPPESEEIARDVMTSEIYHVTVDATLPDVARKMVSHKIHRVLVTSPKDGRIVGIVTTMGVLAALAS